ncbi:uncharacterized protein LOC113383587 [Ctenocephalides felis]|uniref:uncharacterized protein LOC113383587 n=1 Tax=Ctenocephalides felis TaxID=7515 RepID=UPI000E6E399E|nr:uncharacterized protein LOC113383587 [Ctenocephalides felis]
MDSGGEGTSEKREDVEPAVAVAQSRSTSDYHTKSLKDSLIGIKRVADLAEQAAIVQQQAAEDAIRAAADAKTAAEAARIDTVYHKSLEDSLIGIKRVADLAEQAAIVQQQAAEDAIRAAADAKTAAEAARKTANDREIARHEYPLPGIDTVYHKSLEDSLIGIKRVADLAEQVAIVKQQAAEDAIKAAADAKTAAEAARKTANDRERARRGCN